MLCFVIMSVLNYGFLNAAYYSIDTESVLVDCQNKEELDSVKPFTEEVLVARVFINNCPIPEGPYKPILDKLNISTNTMSSLIISLSSLNHPFELHYSNFEDLKLGTRVHFVNFYSFVDYIEYDFLIKDNGKTNISNGDTLTIYNSWDSDHLQKPNILVKNRKLYVKEVKWHFWDNKNMESVNLKQILDGANIEVQHARISLTIYSENLYEELILPAHTLSNVQLETLNIKVIENRINLDAKIFEDNLVTLKEINFDGVNLPSLPKGNIIQKAKLENGVSINKFGNCEELSILKLKNWRFLQDNHLRNCNEIVEMHLENMLKSDITQILKLTKFVTEVFIKDCNFGNSIPLGETKLANLYHLDLARNNITALEFYHLPTRGLLTLKGSKTLPALKTLILDDNPLSKLCDAMMPIESFTQEIYLRNTGLKTLCFGKLNRVKTLNLTNGKIEALELTELPLHHDYNVVVDLRSNPLQTFGKEENICIRLETPESFISMSKNMTIIVDWRLPCDCKGGCISRALRKYPQLRIEGAVCTDNMPFHSRKPDHIARLECSKFPCSRCTCRRSWQDNSTTADCTAVDLRRIPFNVSHQLNLKKLFASNNRISKISEEDLPDSLMFIDLRDNGPLRADKNASNVLFSIPERTILMAGTAPVCACDENRLWIEALQAHQSMIPDYKNITTTCFGEEMALKDIILEDLCAITLEYWFWLILMILIITVAAALYFAYYKYERQIKMFLFIHGWCMCCLSEEDIDCDREYDAFISFCHEDDEFVHEKIIPELSEYKLCIHYRDWLAGDWIPAQIARSIDQSKRTIVVLSNTFLKSRWGLMEFRMAHAATSEEGRARVIVILLENIFEHEDLDAELKSYLATNTYVKWGDPWFFNKLKFALPHRKQRAATDDVTVEEFRLAAATYRRDDEGDEVESRHHHERLEGH